MQDSFLLMFWCKKVETSCAFASENKDSSEETLYECVCKLVHTRRALSSTITNSHQKPVSEKACNPPDPH
jgi:hypothetical protein